MRKLRTSRSDAGWGGRIVGGAGSPRPLGVPGEPRDVDGPLVAVWPALTWPTAASFAFLAPSAAAPAATPAPAAAPLAPGPPALPAVPPAPFPPGVYGRAWPPEPLIPKLPAVLRIFCGAATALAAAPVAAPLWVWIVWNASPVKCTNFTAIHGAKPATVRINRPAINCVNCWVEESPVEPRLFMSTPKPTTKTMTSTIFDAINATVYSIHFRTHPAVMSDKLPANATGANTAVRISSTLRTIKASHTSTVAAHVNRAASSRVAGPY